MSFQITYMYDCGSQNRGSESKTKRVAVLSEGDREMFLLAEAIGSLYSIKRVK